MPLGHWLLMFLALPSRESKEVSVIYTYLPAWVHISFSLHLSLCVSPSLCTCVYISAYSSFIFISCQDAFIAVGSSQLSSGLIVAFPFSIILLPAARLSVHPFTCPLSQYVQFTCCSSPSFRDLLPLGTRIAVYSVNVVTVVITGYSYGFFCHLKFCLFGITSKSIPAWFQIYYVDSQE